MSKKMQNHINITHFQINYDPCDFHLKEPKTPPDRDTYIKVAILQGGPFCFYTGEPFDFTKHIPPPNCKIDYILPRDYGGAHTWRNLVLTTKTAKTKKGSKPPYADSNPYKSIIIPELLSRQEWIAPDILQSFYLHSLLRNVFSGIPKSPIEYGYNKDRAWYRPLQHISSDLKELLNHSREGKQLHLNWLDNAMRHYRDIDEKSPTPRDIIAASMITARFLRDTYFKGYKGDWTLPNDFRDSPQEYIVGDVVSSILHEITETLTKDPPQYEHPFMAL